MSEGKVYLVGAGPGSPDLITVRGIRAIKKADVIICDGLLGPEFLDGLGISLKDKQVEWLKDTNGRKSQEKINELMLHAARQGKIVARVKTGDPHVFGKGAEEVGFLINQCIACEVIPGLTVATAFSSLVDLALTERQKGKSFAVVTARCAGGKVNEDFPRADSLIIFMGVAVLGEITAKLQQDGWPAETPAAILERVGMPWQRGAEGTLENIAELVLQADISAPAVLVIGRAAHKPETLKQRPRILFTGLDPANFRTMGTILHWPAIRVVKNQKECEKLPDIVHQLTGNRFAYIIFTSKTSVHVFFEGIKEAGFDCRVLNNTKVVACGNGTAEKLEEYGIVADVIPAGMGSSAILANVGTEQGVNVLLIQSGTATEELATKLTEKFGDVERLCLHGVEPHPELGRKLPGHDVVYFTCPSGARAFWKEYGRDGFAMGVWCIGEATATQLKTFGVDAKVVSPYVS